MHQETPVEDLLVFTDVEYARASTAKRFLNYIIDIASFYLFIFLALIVFVVVAPEAYSSFINDIGSLTDRVLTLIVYALYLGAVEALFKGKTLGKLITRTRGVNYDGSQISANTAFLRGLSRAVPFAVFSALGSPCNPWQDKWTNTLVIDERQL